MEINQQTLVGLGACLLTTFSLFPQLVKLVKEKKAEGISFFMLAILFSGLAAWIFYGFLKKDWILIIANSVSLVLNGIIMTLTLKYKR